MDAEAFRKVEPSEFYRAFYSQNVRPDGRSFSTFRNPLLSNNIIQKCHGSASLRCGNAFYVAVVQGEIESNRNGGETEEIALSHNYQPQTSSLEAQNNIIVNVQLPKNYGFEIKDALGPSIGISGYIAGTLSELLNASTVLDSNFLKIDGNTARWVLFVTILCIEYDGNYTDLPLLVAVAALENTILPAVYWDAKENWWRQTTASLQGEFVGVMGDDFTASKSKQPLPVGVLKTHHTPTPAFQATVVILSRPLSVTFANVLGSFWVADPCKEEEELGTSLTLYKLKDKWSVRRLGGSDLQLASMEHDLKPIAAVIIDGFHSVLNKIIASS